MREALAVLCVLAPALAGCLAGDGGEVPHAGEAGDGGWVGSCQRLSVSLRTTREAAQAVLPDGYEARSEGQVAVVGFVFDRCPALGRGETLVHHGFLAIAYVLLEGPGDGSDHAYVIHAATNASAPAADLRGAGLPVVEGTLEPLDDGWRMRAGDVEVEVRAPVPGLDHEDDVQRFLFHHDGAAPLAHRFRADSTLQHDVTVRAAGGPFDDLIPLPINHGMGGTYEGILEFQNG